jgi:hypothetical protein
MEEESKITEILQNQLVEPMSFSQYLAFFESLVNENTTNWPEKTDEMIHYTKLNWQRTNRVKKTFTPSDNWENIKLEPNSISAFTLTEPWCGDAAQNLPILQNILEKLDIKHILVLRDKNQDLMELLLSNGAKAIPKTVFVDSETLFPLFTWGARPAAAQQLVDDYKVAPEPKKSYMEFAEDLHKWYNTNKGKDMEAELLELFETISEEE